MKSSMKKPLSLAASLFEWAFTAFSILALAAAMFSFLQAKKTGEPITVFGYRPVYVLTGSMEPYMMTDSIVITRAVAGGEALREGDVVTYHVEDADGKELAITHRILEIQEDGLILTKGDNNRVADAYPITADNADAKVVLPLNWTAQLIHTWADRKGKILICSVLLCAAILYFGVRELLSGDGEEDDGRDKSHPATALPETK